MRDEISEVGGLNREANVNTEISETNSDNRPYLIMVDGKLINPEEDFDTEEADINATMSATCPDNTPYHLIMRDGILTARELPPTKLSTDAQMRILETNPPSLYRAPATRGMSRAMTQADIEEAMKPSSNNPSWSSEPQAQAADESETLFFRTAASVNDRFWNPEPRAQDIDESKASIPWNATSSSDSSESLEPQAEDGNRIEASLLRTFTNVDVQFNQEPIPQLFPEAANNPVPQSTNANQARNPLPIPCSDSNNWHLCHHCYDNYQVKRWEDHQARPEYVGCEDLARFTFIMGSKIDANTYRCHLCKKTLEQCHPAGDHSGLDHCERNPCAILGSHSGPTYPCERCFKIDGPIKNIVCDVCLCADHTWILANRSSYLQPTTVPLCAICAEMTRAEEPDPRGHRGCQCPVNVHNPTCRVPRGTSKICRTCRIIVLDDLQMKRRVGRTSEIVGMGINNGVIDTAVIGTRCWCGNMVEGKGTEAWGCLACWKMSHNGFTEDLHQGKLGE